MQSELWSNVCQLVAYFPLSDVLQIVDEINNLFFNSSKSEALDEVVI